MTSIPDATSVLLTEEERAELDALARSTKTEHRLRQRARIVLLAADGLGTGEIVVRTGVSKPTVIAWKRRYAAEGIGGLEDRPRPGKPRTTDDVAIVLRTWWAFTSTRPIRPSCCVSTKNPGPGAGTHHAGAAAAARHPGEIITRQAIRRGSFTSVTDLIAAIENFIDGWNDRCYPFTWAKTADELLPHCKPSKRTTFTRR